MGQGALDYYRSHHREFLEGLVRLLKIPSISTLPEHKPDIRRAAKFLADEFRSLGMDHTELIEGRQGENPLVYAEWLRAPHRPTVLLYGHYDVQPADPLNEWTSPPFQPAVRGQNLFARGSSDDKGQTYIMLKAAEGFLKAEGRFPLNVKFLIEGEEEVGGAHVESFVSQQQRKLQADAGVICDTAMFAPELPTLTTGLRGLVYLEVEARGAAHDLHSGLYGGVAPNPLQALASILARLKGPDERVRIPGFYKRVKKPSPAERISWKQLPFREQRFHRKEVGSAGLTGEKGFTVLERLWARPTLEVHGIRGGFTAAGAKTVIPAVALAKVSMRLVPAMRPTAIIRQFTQQVKKCTPRGIQTTVRVLSAAPAVLVSTRNSYMRAAAEALEQVFRTKPVYVRSGGSIPIAGLITGHLGIPVVLMGFGLPDDNLHAPDEKLYLPNFYRGIESVGRFFEILARREL